MTATAANDEVKSLVKKAIAEGAGKPGAFTFWDLTDDGLIRVRRQYLRMIEDGQFTNHPEPLLRVWLANIRWVRLVRWCLHMRYGAMDLGTESFDRYNRFGEAPSYALALSMDYLRWSLRDRIHLPGLRGHILDWSRFQPPGAFPQLAGS